jgi:hypothetical protein
VQAKFRPGAVRDPLEHEANRVADDVMRNLTPGVSAGAAPLRVRSKRSEGAGTETLPNRTSGPQAVSGEAPSTVRDVVRSPGRPLDPATLAFFEPRFGRDFSDVRVHTDSLAEQSARDVNANAYTVGHHIVFDGGRFEPATTGGSRLLAHELAHVLQQSDTNGDQAPATGDLWRKVSVTPVSGLIVQRDAAAEFNTPPKQLVDQYRLEMAYDHFEGLARRLYVNFTFQGFRYDYVREVFKEIPSDYEDNVAALFVELIADPQLDLFAASPDGRAMLDVAYEAMITGDVSSFEREQSNRVLFARARSIKPEDYIAQAKRHSEKQRTKIFPVRFPRVTPGYDDAPLEAKLLSNGKIWVHYPTRVLYEDSFKEEKATPIYGAFLSDGLELPADEIVGIRQYEQGGRTDYLPAVALIDFSNQVTQSTVGKIIQVSIAAATLGMAGPAGVNAELGGAEAGVAETAGARWAARLAWADRVAGYVAVLSFVVHENRDWIVARFGKAGRWLVKATEIADSVLAIYGIARLGIGAHALAKDLAAASKACREEAAALRALENEEKQVIDRINNETDSLINELNKAEGAEASSTTGAEAKGETEGPATGDKATGPEEGALGPGAASVYDESFAVNRKYDGSIKHLDEPREVGGVEVSKEPSDGQTALDDSFPLPNTDRRIGVDVKNKEFVVLDRTGNLVRNKKVVGGVYHGHVRTWDKLSPEMRKALKPYIKVNKRGLITWINPNWDVME